MINEILLVLPKRCLFYLIMEYPRNILSKNEPVFLDMKGKQGKSVFIFKLPLE